MGARRFCVLSAAPIRYHLTDTSESWSFPEECLLQRADVILKQRRLIQLDVLRGLAIVLVLFHHVVIVSQSPSASIWGLLAFPIETIGWAGVDLFFVLSGFLIGGLLFHEIHNTGRLDVKRFLVRRGFKIWPSYLLFIAFVFASLIFSSHHSLSRAFREVLPNLLHVQNYAHSVRGHTWSLSVEEHFYLALPLFLLLAMRWRGRDGHALPAVPIMAILLVAGCTLFRFLHNGPRPYEFNSHRGYTHIRIDGLFVGVLLAYLHHFHPSALARIAKRRTLLLATGLALISPMFFIHHDRYFVWTIGYTMLYTGFSCILLAAVYATPETGLLGRMLVSPPARLLAWIGVFSYSIYLWQFDLAQFPVMYHLNHRVRAHLPVLLHWPLVNGAFMVLAIITGAFMSMIVERPALALREWLFPSRTSGAILPALAQSSAATET